MCHLGSYITMDVSKLTKGISELMSMNKVIDTDDQDTHDSTKVVKLRFTRKQYQTFRDACKIFEVISEDKQFPEFVKSVLGADVKVSTINKQLVQPILDAPVRIPLKLPRAVKAGEQKKDSYFTAPTEATDKCLQLYDAVKSDDLKLRQSIQDGTTCVTDVRVMVSRYISVMDLRGEQGVTLDEFLCKLASKSVHEHSDQLHRVGRHLVIPKGNRKVMTSIVNEITFGR